MPEFRGDWKLFRHSGQSGPRNPSPSFLWRPRVGRIRGGATLAMRIWATSSASPADAAIHKGPTGGTPWNRPVGREPRDLSKPSTNAHCCGLKCRAAGSTLPSRRAGPPQDGTPQTGGDDSKGAADHGDPLVGNARGGGHATGAPAAPAGRTRLQAHADHLHDLLVRNPPRSSSAGRVRKRGDASLRLPRATRRPWCWTSQPFS